MPSSQLFNNPSRSLRIAAWAAVMLCLHAPLQASSTSTSTPTHKHAAKAAPISVIGPVTRSVGTGETMGCEKVSLDAADVARYFATAKQVSAGSFHEESIILPEVERCFSAQEKLMLDEAFAENADPLTGHYPPAQAFEKLFSMIVTRAPSPIGLG